MSSTTRALPMITRAALRQTRIELRIQLLSWSVLSWLFLPVIGIVVLLFLRGQRIMGTEVSIAQFALPGVITMYLLSTGLMGIAGQLGTEREDGTLLRAKALPHGMSAHLLSSVLTFLAVSLAPILLLLALAGLLVPGVAPDGPTAWWTLLWVSVLGLGASLPFGAVLGALLRSPVMLGMVALVVYATAAISGVFYPLAALPGWLQGIGQVLPTYWIGLGLRSALLPEAASALELGGSWHPTETALVLLGWTVLGLLLAPIALRRMARRQSGSVVTAARERVMSRGY